LSGCHVWLIVLKGALIFPPSTKFYWQDAWMNEDIENRYRLYISTSSLKTKLTRKSQVIIIQIWEPKRIGKTSEEELKKLANVFVDGHG
jgi:hypothetical protein